MGLRLRREPATGRREAPADGAAVDAAWHVLEAANELGDEATVAACRRLIDSSLNGTVADQADMQLVTDYFR
ncbi:MULTISPECIES: hypothetical protein [unclassified Bradyrhizobium]|uniref:hypothetical protein n=1 Tax=unclassified Bradyrhizobium TaxID=2631580 RepID=UPI0024E14BDE|nr:MULTISPECIES: hypothetical protein [unclassified Bradyrhizobium]